MPIQIKNVSYIYDDGSDYKIEALKNITTEINKNKMTAIIGHTGCGKTTLMQHLNALLLPSTGEIVIDDFTIKNIKKQKSLKSLRSKVGLVFQFSENQLFEETVGKDIAFGPRNFKVDEDEIKKRIHEVIHLVGLDESYLERSCFQLSGGEKRRVAIAGILAMDPEIIILDEPTAGLDPNGIHEMMHLFKNLNEQHHKTIIVVTHDNDLVYQYFDYVMLLDKGQLITHSEVNDFFENQKNIILPKIIELKRLFEKNGIYISKKAKTVEEVLMEVQSYERTR